MAATSPFTGTSVKSVDPSERPQAGALGNVREQLQSAFRLAYFIHPDRELAIRIAREAMDDLAAAKATQRRRLYYTPSGFSPGCAKPQTPRTKAVMSDAHLLQRLVYRASEVYEIEQERAQSEGRLTEEDLLIRFVKHLVRITVRRSSFYVALGISRLLHGYSTAETMEIYTAVVGDPDRVKEDSYYRACKRELMSELEERFGKFLRRTRAPRGEERFAEEEETSRHSSLARECLRVFTPWETTCVTAAEFNRDGDQLSHLAFEGEEPDREHPVELNRMHAITHPECYRQVTAALGLAKPESRLSLPRFQIDHSNDRRPPVDRQRPPGLTEEEMRGLLSEVDRQADRRRRISARHLSILVDGARVGTLDFVKGNRLVLLESSELIEVRGRDDEGEVKLGAVLLRCTDRCSGEVSEHTIVLDGGQKITFSVSFRKDVYGEAGDVVVELAGEETKSGRAAWQELRDSLQAVREESTQYVIRGFARKESPLFGMKATGDREVLRLAEMQPMNYAELSEALIRGAVSAAVLKKVGDRLVSFAESAYGSRRIEDVEELSQLLLNSSLPLQYEYVGLFYMALALQLRGGQVRFHDAAALQQFVFDNATPFYRLRALNGLVTNACSTGDRQSALLLLRDGAHLTSRDRIHNLPTSVALQLNRAVIEGTEGRHGYALALIENVRPLAESIRFARSHIYFTYLNSLAVELGAVGRLEEAEHACGIVLGSPIANAYNEWHETRKELELLRGPQASRSQIAIGR